MQRNYAAEWQDVKKTLVHIGKKVKGLAKRIFSGRFFIFVKRPRLWLWLLFLDFPYLYSYAYHNLFHFYYGFQFHSFMLLLLLAVMLLIPQLLLCFIVLSRPVEAFLRRLEDARRIATQAETERLLPLFENVYHTVLKQKPRFHKSIHLYIIDTAEVNACSVGYDSIILTRGLIQTMNDEEIKGTLAHEFAHILKGDSQIQQLLYFATSWLLWIVLALDKFLRFISDAAGGGFFGTIAFFLHSVLTFVVNLVVNFFLLIVSAPNKILEYRADEYAFSIGYGEGLKSALYKLYDMQISDKQKLITRLQEDHPRVAYRIERLEHLEKA